MSVAKTVAAVGGAILLASGIGGKLYAEGAAKSALDEMAASKDSAVEIQYNNLSAWPFGLAVSADDVIVKWRRDGAVLHMSNLRLGLAAKAESPKLEVPNAYTATAESISAWAAFGFGGDLAAPTPDFGKIASSLFWVRLEAKNLRLEKAARAGTRGPAPKEAVTLDSFSVPMLRSGTADLRASGLKIEGVDAPFSLPSGLSAEIDGISLPSMFAGKQKDALNLFGAGALRLRSALPASAGKPERTRSIVFDKIKHGPGGVVGGHLLVDYQDALAELAAAGKPNLALDLAKESGAERLDISYEATSEIEPSGKLVAKPAKLRFGDIAAFEFSGEIENLPQASAEAAKGLPTWRSLRIGIEGGTKADAFLDALAKRVGPRAAMAETVGNVLAAISAPPGRPGAVPTRTPQGDAAKAAAKAFFAKPDRLTIDLSVKEPVEIGARLKTPPELVVKAGG